MPTPQHMWITSHVERCLQQVFETCELKADPEGDYPYRQGTAACWVRVARAEPHFVRVFGHAAHGLRGTGKLLAEVNDINTRTTTAKVYFEQGVVVVQQVLHPAAVTPETLSQAVGSVGQVAEDIGYLIASVHGGATPFGPQEHQGSEA